MKIRIFKAITLKWWQISIFKISATSFGMAIGVYWADFFNGWLTALLIIFFVGWLYLATVWVKNWNS